jgi:hypothetical protein
MWMVNPNSLCKKHLLGEHGELHKFLHNWLKQHSISGRVAINSIEPLAYKARHDSLAEEMLRRGYNHKSPIEQPDFSYLPEHERLATVDKSLALKLLIERCPDCAAQNIQLSR